MSTEINNLDKLCIHTITTKSLQFKDACAAYSNAGINGITIWREAVKNLTPAEVRNILNKYKLEIVSYCRGGFFPNIRKSKRIEAVNDTIQMIEEAASIGAPMVVLVCGADPGQSLEQSRQQIKEGIIACLPLAEKHKIKLAIEPLHPMYSDNRSAINTLEQANDMAEAIQSPFIGVAVDVYHLWWDPHLKREIDRCGKNKNLFAYHISDWKTPTTHMLLDRGLMGEGCINLQEIRGWIKNAGFDGYHEVEIFSENYWSQDQKLFLNSIINAYLKYS
jgi:sugar phosphate isomerase/epimerase